jgi:hypothetical protein
MRGRKECRVFSAPAALCAKGESTQVSHHRYAEHSGIPCATVLTAYSALSLAIGLFVTITSAMRKHCRQLDISVEISGPHGLAVRFPRVRLSRAKASIAIPRPTFSDDRETPLSLRARDARKNASDLPDATRQTSATRWHDGQITCGVQNPVK